MRMTCSPVFRSAGSSSTNSQFPNNPDHDPNEKTQSRHTAPHQHHCKCAVQRREHFFHCPFIFFRFYFSCMDFQEGIVSVSDAYEGMLNHLTETKLPGFHAGAERPGIHRGLLIPDLRDSKKPSARCHCTDQYPYDESLSSLP